MNNSSKDFVCLVMFSQHLVNVINKNLDEAMHDPKKAQDKLIDIAIAEAPLEAWLESPLGELPKVNI